MDDNLLADVRARLKAAREEWKVEQRKRDAAPVMLEALKALDAWWLKEFPEGPDGNREWGGGFGILSEDTVEIWRQIRSAISLAEVRP